MFASNDTSLEIHLCGSSDLVVDTILFRHSLLGQKPRRLNRGKIAPTVSGAAPLPWTSAVKAFVQLAIQLALQRFAGGEGDSDPFLYGLSGDKGSPCRSLDYAISKKPAWIVDLFGADADGDSHVGRFFWRRNPEGKRPGPSGVTFNTKMLAPENVVICLNGSYLDGRDQLNGALKVLSSSLSSRRPPRRGVNDCHGKLREARGPQSDDGALNHVLAGLMKRELLRTLSSTPIFSRHGLVESVQEVGKSRLFKAIAGKHTHSLDSVLEWSSHTARTGVTPSLHTLQTFYSPDKPLQVSVSVVTIGTIVLFQYLKVFRNLQLPIFNRH
jgi:hypothetical protein